MLRHVPREDMHVPAYTCWFAEGNPGKHTPDKDVSAKCIAQRVAGANESKPIFQEVKNQKMFKSNSLKMQVSTQTQQGNPHNPHLNNAKASCFVIPERFFVRHNLGTNLSHASVKHPSVFNCKLWEENVGMFHRSKKPHLDNIVNKGDSLLSQNHDRILLWLDSTTNKTFQAPHWAHFASLCRKETAVSPAPKKIWSQVITYITYMLQMKVLFRLCFGAAMCYVSIPPLYHRPEGAWSKKNIPNSHMISLCSIRVHLPKHKTQSLFYVFQGEIQASLL
jgi:hypothetical protein